jgi:hypothetical protein
MNEDKVRELATKWLEGQGYKVKPDPPAPLDSEKPEVLLDLYAYRNTEPEVYWLECKGDVNLSELLEGFIRTELCVHYGGGLGLLAVPSLSARKLMRIKDFLGRSFEKIALLDVEKGKILKFEAEAKRGEIA